MGSTFNSLIGLIILALDIWAIINVFKSGASTGAKVLWILLILLLPVLGLIIWAIAGPRGNVRICRPTRLGAGTVNGGAGLPAIAGGQLALFWLTPRYRRQACSHSGVYGVN